MLNQYKYYALCPLELVFNVVKEIAVNEVAEIKIM